MLGSDRTPRCNLRWAAWSIEHESADRLAHHVADDVLDAERWIVGRLGPGRRDRP
jgi:hypothetical protein